MNKLIDNPILRAAATIVLAITPFAVSAQKATPQPPEKPDIKSTPPPRTLPAPTSRASSPAPHPRPEPPSRDTGEKSIKVDPNVNLWLGCVREGSVKINGWNRNEVRVFIEDGSKFAFSTTQKNNKGEPVWIKLVSAESKNKYGPNSECISGGEIQVDAPINATISIRGYDINTTIDTVRKVEVTVTGGDVSVRNVTSGIMVSAGRGDVTVDSSQGKMNLETTTGNILVFEGGPSEIGDAFRAKTNNGAIVLQTLDFRQITVGSVTGSVAYTGEIQNGGSYDMNTSKGSIRLTIPVKSSFQMWATYGFGNFSSEIPIDIATENIMPGPIKTVRGKAGTGGATLKLTTNNGSISIKKM
ncbi:MAG: DUF4097 family beta strand repeat-containing protein [Pyrinomonadaceae bacterium]